MKALIVHGVLALAGLVAAYRVWTAGPVEESEANQVTIVDCEPAAVKRVRFEGESKEILLEIKGDEDKRALWFTIKPVEKKQAESKVPEPASTPKVKTFVGGKRAEEYLASVAPFKALRSLGKPAKDTLKELGLAEPKGKLELFCGGKKRVFLLGGDAFGSGDRYLRDGNKGPVYLVESQKIRELESAEFQLMQRELHRFDKKDVETLVIAAEGAKRTLKQRNRLDPQRAEWVDAAAPDRRNELFGNWLSRVERLRAQEFLGPKEQPSASEPGASLSTAVTLTYLDEDGEELGRLELARLDVPEKTPRYFARSEATFAWVEVPSSVGAEVDSDVRVVLGLEQPPSPDKPAVESTAPRSEPAVPSSTEAEAPAAAQQP